jgi:hypothetical protein
MEKTNGKDERKRQTEQILLFLAIISGLLIVNKRITTKSEISVRIQLLFSGLHVYRVKCFWLIQFLS